MRAQNLAPSAAAIIFPVRSTIGKMAAMWLPIMIFFALGFEHSIVNMVVVPVGMMLKAPVSMGQWWDGDGEAVEPDR